MGSTDIPSNEVMKMVRIQCQTPEDGQLELAIDASKFQELLAHIRTTLVHCKYKIIGCITNDYGKDISEHEANCSYRTVSCPILPTENLCEDIMVMELVEHITDLHKTDCICTEESVFSVPIDLNEAIQLSKLVQIRGEIILFRVKTEDLKLHTSLLFIRNTNAYKNCKISIMAGDIEWNHQQFQISDTNASFNEHQEQSAAFDLEKLMQVRNVFSSIGVRVDLFNSTVAENIVQAVPICAICEDFLTAVYYECEGNTHCMYCETCYKFADYNRIISYRPTKLQCKKCNFGVSSSERSLLLRDSYKMCVYPCANQSVGCKQYVPRYTSRHELLCPSRVFNCVQCTFSGKYSEFISHLEKNHTENMVFANTIVFVQKHSSESLYYMFAFGSVFLYRKISYTKNCTIEWLRTSDVKHNFTFELTFNYKNGERITLKANAANENVHYFPLFCKSVYHTTKKIAYFIWHVNRWPSEDEITVTIHKD